MSTSRIAVYAVLTSFLIMIPLGAVMLWASVDWWMRMATFSIISFVVGLRQGVLASRRQRGVK